MLAEPMKSIADKLNNNRALKYALNYVMTMQIKSLINMVIIQLFERKVVI